MTYRHLPAFFFLTLSLASLAPASAQPLLRLDPDAGAPVPTAALSEAHGGLLYSAPDGSQIAIASDASDVAQDYDGQAGAAAHFRLSRGPCNPYMDPRAQPGCDRANPGARDFTIAPYYYGIAFSYPGLIEMNLGGLSIHANHASCHEQWGCTGSGQLFVGDQFDFGGWWLTAVTPHAGAKGYVSAAADHWNHTSIGDMRLVVRDPSDKVAIYSGAFGTEAEVASFSGLGELTCHGAISTPAVVLQGATGDARLEAAPDGMGFYLRKADGSLWSVGLTLVP